MIERIPSEIHEYFFDNACPLGLQERLMTSFRKYQESPNELSYEDFVKRAIGEINQYIEENRLPNQNPYTYFHEDELDDLFF